MTFLCLQQGIEESKPLFPIVSQSDRSASPAVVQASTSSETPPQPSTSTAVKTETEAETAGSDVDDASADGDDAPVLTEADLIESG